jgi:hypothetical protein
VNAGLGYYMRHADLHAACAGYVQIFTFWMWRSQLQLVIQLLGVSGHGLADNLGLVGAVLGLQVGYWTSHFCD